VKSAALLDYGLRVCGDDLLAEVNLPTVGRFFTVEDVGT